MNVLVFDVGSSSMRGVLFNEHGKNLCTKQFKYTADAISDVKVEMKPELLKQALYENARGIAEYCRENNEGVDLITITSQRSSIAPVDQDGNALMNFIYWQDKRNAAIVERLSRSNDRIFAVTGTRVNTVYSGSKMVWIHENAPDIYARAAHIVTIPEFLIHLLTGEYKTDSTYASRSNLMDIRKCRWSKDMLELFNLDGGKLSEICQPGEILGYTTEEFRNSTGILSGIPVCSSGGDQQCAAVGIGVYKQGRVSIVLGTGAYLTTACDTVPENLDSSIICNASSVSGNYILEANAPSCGCAFDWFIRNFYNAEFDYGKLAADIEDQYHKDSSLIVLPDFQGRTTPDWNTSAHAQFCNISLSTTRAEMLAGLLDGIFLNIRENIDHMRKLIPVETGYISGGMTNMPVINQMQADAYGIPLNRLKNAESTSLGALIVALTGQKVYSSVGEAFENTAESSVDCQYVPDEARAQRMSAKYCKMKEMYQRIYNFQ